jgi:cell division protein FtsL
MALNTLMTISVRRKSRLMTTNTKMIFGTIVEAVLPVASAIVSSTAISYRTFSEQAQANQRAALARLQAARKHALEDQVAA